MNDELSWALGMSSPYNATDTPDNSQHDAVNTYAGGTGLAAISPQVYALIYIVGSLALLWLLGGVMFRRSNS